MASVEKSASVCGIDVGTENCYVAVVSRGGIEVLLNEFSQRSTPAYVGLGNRSRDLGYQAKQGHAMNLKNTCYALTSIIGKKFSEVERSGLTQNLLFTLSSDANDNIVIKLTHGGEEKVFTPGQVLAMLFTKLRQVANNPADAVINCPYHFTDPQRRALMDAALIAGLTPIKVISDISAVALYYGFYRSMYLKQDPTIVVFVNCGQTSTQIAAVLYHVKDNIVRILEAESLNVGGVDFDRVLANHFIDKHKLNPESDPLSKRSRQRLLAECEKLKKMMSANTNQLPISIECLKGESDFRSSMSRKEFEELSSHLFERIRNALVNTKLRAEEKYKKDFAEKHGPFQIHSAEIVGGTSRIPAIKSLIKEVFEVPQTSTTLNADEAVANGCALQCAFLSPTSKVARQLQLIDSLPYQVDFNYGVEGGEFKPVKALFPRGHQFPFTKQISLASQRLPLYVSFDSVYGDSKELIGQYVITEQPGSNAAELMMIHNSPIKLRVRVDQNGLVTVASASISYEKMEEVVEETKEEPMDQSSDNATATNSNPAETEKMDTDESNEKEPKRKTKAKLITLDLKIDVEFVAGKLSPSMLNQYIEIESNLILADKNWKEKADARNSLEEFIYEWREKMENPTYSDYLTDDVKEKFQNVMSANMNWLEENEYDDFSNFSKTVFHDKKTEMEHTYVNSVMFRKSEWENRTSLLEQFGHCIQMAHKVLEQPEEEEAKELEKLKAEAVTKQGRLDWFCNQLKAAQKNQDPPQGCMLKDINDEMIVLRDMIEEIRKARAKRLEQRRKAAEEAKKKLEEEKKLAEEKRKAEEAAKQSGDPVNNGDTSTPANGESTGQMEVDEQPATTA